MEKICKEFSETLKITSVSIYCSVDYSKVSIPVCLIQRFWELSDLLHIYKMAALMSV